MKRAFTLVEVLTTVAIMTSIMVVVSVFQYNVLNYNRASGVALINVTEAQAIMKNIARELRSAEPGENGEYPLAIVATSTLTFFADLNADGRSEKIRYYISGSTLYRGIIVPTGIPAVYSSGSETIKTLTTGIRNSSTTPLFQYYPSSYNGTSTALTYPVSISTIRLVRVDLRIDTDPNKSPIIRTYSTQVQLRNLKDNL
jgi:prepilin-type N-terminal cleavage/methylation domain-containing protein